MMKKAQINQELFMRILAIILIVLLIFLAIRSCTTIKEKHREVILTDMQGEISNAVDLLSPKYGSVKEYTFELPEGVDTVCFVDLNHSDVILQNTTLPQNYPLISSSIESESTDNMFMIDNYDVVQALDIGDICFDYYPFYSCIATPENLLHVWFEGRNGCTTLYINWSMFPDNKRDMSLYDNDPLFLIVEKRPGAEIENWRDVLRTIPLTLFIEGNLDYNYPFSIVYKPGALGGVTATDIDYMAGVYSAEKTYIADTSYSGTTSSTAVKIQTTKPEYFGFWTAYDGIVLVDKDNDDAGLIAALLAGYINSPLIFIDDSNLNDYKILIDGRQVFIVSHGPISLDSTTFSYVKDHAIRYEVIADTLLGAEGSVPSFVKLFSRIKING